jgi:hypothetical protein
MGVRRPSGQPVLLGCMSTGVSIYDEVHLIAAHSRERLHPQL